MKLLIVESPGKIKKIQGILGSDFRVMASVGHVRDLPQKSLGVDLAGYKPLYEASERGANVLAGIASVAKSATEIYLATDPDREGEAIAWHLADALQLPKGKFKRVTFAEISEGAIKRAIKTPRQIDQNLVFAQEARRVLDRLVGYQVSPLLTEALKSARFLSAGRVQSPALRIIVEREQAIRAFRPTAHFGVTLNLGGWGAAWETKNFLAAGSPYILDKELAGRVAQTKQVKVIDYKKAESKESPPAPFNTSTLQQAASNALKLSLDKVMSVAQKLYEAGLITYMRTDSLNLSKEAIEQIRAYALHEEMPVAAAPRTWKNPEGAQEAHEAIRPTHIEVEEAGDSAEEKALYRLIRLRALASQMQEAIYAVRQVRLESTTQIHSKPVYFTAQGRGCIKQGWRSIMAQDDSSADDDEAELSNPIPELVKAMLIQVHKSELNHKQTTPPKRYTQAALVRELEKLGIGRPATYAPTVSGLIGKNYLRLDKNNLVPAQTGETIINALREKFSFLDLKFTRELEGKLDLIAKGKSTYLEVVKMADEKLQGELSKFTNGKPCETCGGRVIRRKGVSNKNNEPYDFYTCVKCEAKYSSNEDGSRGALRQSKIEEGGACDVCDQMSVVRRQGVSKKNDQPYDFYVCTNKQCNAKYWTEKDGSQGNQIKPKS